MDPLGIVGVLIAVVGNLLGWYLNARWARENRQEWLAIADEWRQLARRGEQLESHARSLVALEEHYTREEVDR